MAARLLALPVLAGFLCVGGLAATVTAGENEAIPVATAGEATLVEAAGTTAFETDAAGSSESADPQQHPVYELRPEPYADGEALPVSLAELLEYAVENNFGLGRQRYSIEKNHFSVDQTYYAFDPSLSASLSYNRRASGGAAAAAGGGLSSSESYSLQGGINIPREAGDSFSANYSLNRSSYSITGAGGDTEIPTTYGSGYGISYSRPLGRGGGTFINRIPRFIASNSLELSYNQLDDQVRKLKAQVMDAYFQAVAAREAITVREASLDRALKQLERSVERFKAGLAIRAEMLQAENSVLSQRSQLLTARANYAALLDSLTALIGVPRELALKPDPEAALIELGGELPDALWEMVQENSIELKSLNTQLDNLRLTREQQLNRLEPDLNLNLNYGRSGEDKTAGLAITGYENENYGFSVNWSATPGERASKASLAQTELDLASLELSIQEAELSLKSSLRNYQRDLETKRQQVELAQGNLTVLQETYDIAVERNNVGLGVALDVVEAQENLLGGELALLNAKVAYQETYRQLQLMAGLI